MFENEYPLLSTPSLMTLILHRAEGGPVTLDDCADRVAALFAEAKEKPGLPPEAIRERLSDHLGGLEIAGLVERIPGGAWRLTLRGRDALRRHPRGIDPVELMEFPEYAAHVRAQGRAAPGMDPRAASYDEGYEARREGQPFAANPYTANTVDHLSWENGWMQALDDEKQA
jgi:restriction endonuclease Mrr